MPPVALTAARALLAAAVLLPVWWIVEGKAVVLGANWLKGAWVGFVTLGLASFFVIIALHYNDPVTVAIVSAVMPVIGILLECLADHRPFTRALATGLVLSVAGGLIAVNGAEGEVSFGIGVLAAVASVALYTWGSRETVKAFPDLTPLGRSTITIAGAAIVATARGAGRRGDAAASGRTGARSAGRSSAALPPSGSARWPSPSFSGSSRSGGSASGRPRCT
jgi:drug/metabolite transporter (DMT)-like permease